MKRTLFRALSLIFLISVITLDVGYAQSYPTTQQSNLINLYKQADTKGLPVIGSGAPVFTPRAKQSRVYIDSIAGEIYCRKAGSWVKIVGSGVIGENASNSDLDQDADRSYNGHGYDYLIDSIGFYDLFANTNIRLTSPDIVFDGNTALTLGSEKFKVDIPSLSGAPAGAILSLSGDSLVYTVFGIYNVAPGNGNILVYSAAQSRYSPSITFNKMSSADTYDNDADAAADGIIVGQLYFLSAANTYSLPEGVVKRRMF